MGFDRGEHPLKSHFAAGEFEAVVRADASALQVRPQGALAGGADDRRVRDFRAHDDRLGAPEPFRAGLFAGGLGGLLLASFAGVLGRGGGWRCAAVPIGRGRFSSLAPPIRIVARHGSTSRRPPARIVTARNSKPRSNTCAPAIPWWSGGSPGWRDPSNKSSRPLMILSKRNRRSRC